MILALLIPLDEPPFQLFHCLGHGDGFGYAHQRVNVVFDSANLDHVQFMPCATGRDDHPNTLLDVRPDHGLPVLRAPNAMVSELGESVGHWVAFALSVD